MNLQSISREFGNKYQSPSDTEESDENNGRERADLDLLLNYNHFKGSFSTTTNANKIKDVVGLFTGNNFKY